MLLSLSLILILGMFMGWICRKTVFLEYLQNFVK